MCRSTRGPTDEIVMPTYIDESGDTGRVANGSSPYFAIAAVWMPDEGEADRFRAEVRALRTKLGLKS